MGTINNNTRTVIEMMQSILLGDGGVIEASALPDLFNGDAPVNVHAKVPGVYRAGTDSSNKRNLLSIYEVVTADNSPFDDNFKGYVRRAHAQGGAKPAGRDAEAAAAGIKKLARNGGITTAAKLDPAAARSRRGRELVAAVRGEHSR